MKSSWWKSALMYGVGLAVLAFTVWRSWEPKGSNPGLKGVLDRSIHLAPYALAAILCVTNTFLTFVRWFLLVRAQGLPFTLKSAIRLGLVGYFFNTFLPGSVGGDLLKAAFIAREQERRTVAVATVIVDRVIGLWGLTVLVSLTGGAFWLSGDQAVVNSAYLRRCVLFAAGLLAASLVAWGLLAVLPERRAVRFAQRLAGLPKVGGMLSEVWRAVRLYATKWRTILTALLMTLTGHTCSVLMFFCVVRALQPEGMPGLGEHFLLVPFGMAAQGFFPAPGGVGGGEFVFGYLYAAVGAPESAGVLGSLGQRLLSWGLALVGLAAFLFIRKELPTPREVEDIAKPPAAPS